MKIIDQQGNTQEVFDVEQNMLSLYGQPKSIKKPKVLLGTYSDYTKVFDVMAEIYCLNQKDNGSVFTMPL